MYGKDLFRASGQYHRETFDISNIEQDIDATLYLFGLEYYRQLRNYYGRDSVPYIRVGATDGLENSNDDQNNTTAEVLMADEIIGKSTFVYGGLQERKSKNTWHSHSPQKPVWP